jgi:hypothetical protein
MKSAIQVPESYQSLQQRVNQQTEIIAALGEKMAQVRSLAAIGEARLNKWQTRTFR